MDFWGRIQSPEAMVGHGHLPKKQSTLASQIGKIPIMCIVFIACIEMILRLSHATFYKKVDTPEELLYLAPYKIMPSRMYMQALVNSKYPPNTVDVDEPILTSPQKLIQRIS